jgi:hypothetical protein
LGIDQFFDGRHNRLMERLFGATRPADRRSPAVGNHCDDDPFDGLGDRYHLDPG